MSKENRNDKELLEHLVKVISSKRFLNKEGIGNEVPFFICPYRIEKHVEMTKIIEQLMNQLARLGVKALHLNIYDKALELLRSRGLLDKLLQGEKDLTKDQLKELLQNTLDVEQYLVPALKEQIDSGEYNVIFLTGIGEVFPYIRSHTVLYNLQSKAKEQPTVMFFPGDYKFSQEKGAVLNLFGRLYDDNYYRAFNILNYEL